MADSVPEKLDNENLSPDDLRPTTVADYDLFLGASRLQQDARDLRIEQVGKPGGKFDAIANRSLAISGILKSLLVERGRQDLVDRLDEMNSPSGLPGVRSLPLE